MSRPDKKRERKLASQGTLERWSCSSKAIVKVKKKIQNKTKRKGTNQGLKERTWFLCFLTFFIFPFPFPFSFPFFSVFQNSKYVSWFVWANSMTVRSIKKKKQSRKPIYICCHFPLVDVCLFLVFIDILISVVSFLASFFLSALFLTFF